MSGFPGIPQTRFLLLLIALLGMLTSSARAKEPVIEFVEALRGREYFDYALIYLDQIAADPNTSAELKELVPYQKAVTLMEGAKTLRTPDAQTQQLDQAMAELEKFAQASPNHPLAGQANSERAHILLNKARAEIWQARSPNNQNKKEEFQARARQFVQQGRTIFQTAHDQHQTYFKSFPVYIDEQKDKDKYDERGKAELRYIRALLDLATCTYEEAQTYDKTAPEYKTILTNASKEFEEIHTKYRSLVAGLHARMWQGKCFEEQDEIGKALGIYNEILGHPGDSLSLKNLQAQVKQFRLICLNHEQRNDFQLVIQEADEWISFPGNRRALRSNVGLGIRWELVRALDSLSESREIANDDKEKLYRQALVHANFINRYPGQYKDVSTFIISQLRGKLGRGEKDPEDFETAYGMARTDIKKVKSFQDEIKAAVEAGKPAADIDKVKQDLRAHLDETGRLLKLALRLTDKETEIDKIHHARYLLAYVYYLSRMNYEAAVLAEFVSQHALKSQSPIALDAAYLSVIAFVQAYNDSPAEFKESDLTLIQKACQHVTANWPQTDTANDARMTLGQIYSQLKQPVDAARWYSEIPENAPQYPKAQLAAGQAYWNGYLNAAILAAELRPTPETLAEWQTKAESHLQSGINQTKGALPETAAAPDEYIAAKISLTQVWLNKGLYKEAIDLLSVEPHSVIKAITVADEAQRPPKGLQSADMASLAYQLLLRGYVGTQQIDQARQTMQQLESVGGKGEHVTEIYKQLGQKIEEELKTLKASGNQERLTAVRSSLETFLNDLSTRPDQTYGSLIWMAETYYGLAQGMSDDPVKSTEYYNKASDQYTKILDRDAQQPEFINDQQTTGIKLRLVNCKRQQKDFEKAEEYVKEIIASSPKALDAQVEACFVYQDWGAASTDQFAKYFTQAINGSPKDKAPYIWGWVTIGNMLQRSIEAGTKNQEFTKTYNDARYYAAYCRHQLGLKQTTNAKRTVELDRAQMEIEAFASTSGTVDDEAWSRIDKLYQQVLTDLGKTPTPLPRAKAVTSLANTGATKGGKSTDASTDPSTETSPTKTSAKKPKPATPPEPAGGSSLMMILMLVVGAIAVAGGSVYFFRKPHKAFQSQLATAPATISIPKIPAPARTRAPGAAAAGKSAGTATIAPSISTTATKPAVKKPAASADSPKQPEGGPTKPAAPRPAKPKPPQASSS
ncbi:MAG: hypothetical protein ACKVT0_04775 [Planctomycetaceae bacterium]